ncbi:restriction endonuclease [Mobiluncus mulieris]|uniref:restriction endonuclease n=1 Tax=Mobiluncus mulieris TaxID=2052 RepID=UPI0021E1EDB4|nr:DEAD/DEAH box helicase family protein [Mobiluncus mulieris]MCV0003412.1 restriction endonuclease [Mobiluncus mulieris]
MTALEFKFASNQQHQQEAIEATCNLFRGQQFSKSSFTVDLGSNGMTKFDELVKGYGNEIRIAPGKLQENLHSVQEESCLPPTNVFTDGRLRDFTIEMETGTGKTYVYIRTIYELNRRYGITKFVIVVPSVAIREGVLKSFQTTRKHFEVLYDCTPFDYFVYDSKNMGSVDNFATSSSIQVMIINIDAFNKGLEEDGTAKEGNLFHRHSEKLGGGFSPCELVSACTPVVIIDEPQSVDNTKQAKAAIKSLNPLFVLRYSATHKQTYNMIYRLTPVESFERHLVKGICVDSVKATANLNGAYVRLESVKSNPFSAKVSIDVRQANGTQKRKAVTVRTGADLYQKSGENTDYENGWVVNNIGAAEGNEFIEFQNGEVLELGEALGDVNDEIVKRAQIRRTIENHLARQFEMWPRGVKVLSLFFIDRVDRYRVYEPEVHSGLYAQMFEEEYAHALNSKVPQRVSKAAGIDKGTWKECYEAVGAPLVTDSHSVHQGYFAKDKKGKFKDSKGAASTADDAGAFALIMQKKETLISFPDNKDEDKNVSFIFSHSALKEGWDNPNVFQICTLVETKDNLTKRQKIGRGLRLCVNQDGERLYDPESNVLTVIANESYDEFASGLQKEFEVADFKFGIIIAQSFTKVSLTDANGVEERFGYKKSKQVYDYLVATGMVDSNGAVTPELQAAAENDVLELPPEFEPAREQIEAIIIQKSQKIQIHDKANEVSVELHKDVTLHPAFQALWDRIRRRTRFQVNVDSEKLIKEATAAVKGMLPVRPPQVTSERASLSIDDSGLTAEGTATSLVNVTGQMKYDLPDPIAELQDAVGLTRGTIKTILERCNRLDEFEVDPATFLAQVGDKINRVKNDLIAKGIKYVKLPEEEWYTMRDLELDDYTAYIGQNAWKPENAEKSLYSYVVYDSAGVELSFAEALDKQEEVLVFAKLPPTFKIDTPLGSYNPDWAYVEDVDGEHHVYFVTETKGGKNGEPVLRDAEKLKIGCAKKHFEALDLGDDFHYNVRTTYKYEATDA